MRSGAGAWAAAGEAVAEGLQLDAVQAAAALGSGFRAGVGGEGQRVTKPAELLEQSIAGFAEQEGHGGHCNYQRLHSPTWALLPLAHTTLPIVVLVTIIIVPASAIPLNAVPYFAGVTCREMGMLALPHRPRGNGEVPQMTSFRGSGNDPNPGLVNLATRTAALGNSKDTHCIVIYTPSLFYV